MGGAELAVAVARQRAETSFIGKALRRVGGVSTYTGGRSVCREHAILNKGPLLRYFVHRRAIAVSWCIALPYHLRCISTF